MTGSHYPGSSNGVLVFDAETTGLPKDWKAPVTDLANWPRVVQLAWLHFDTHGILLEEKSVIIRPEGFSIPAHAASIHGITHARALQEGVTLREALRSFEAAASHAGYVVAHNMAFDAKVIGAEYLRSGLASSLPERNPICTQEAGTAYCKIRSQKGYKWPTLAELHLRLFGRGFKGGHDALADARAAAACFWALREKGFITILDETTTDTDDPPWDVDPPGTATQDKPPPLPRPEALPPPTPEQEVALQALRAFMESRDHCFILTGAAGTGKTFLIRYLLKAIAGRQKIVQLLAPTGRAARVIMEKTGMPAGTVHSHIYSYDGTETDEADDPEEAGALTLKFNLKKNNEPENTVYIVDEASMVSDKASDEDDFLKFGSGRLLADLIKYAALDDPLRDNRLIFVGDPTQLPPVGSPISPALDSGYLAEYFGLVAQAHELTGVVRQQAHSGILANAHRLREAIREARYYELDLDTSPPDLSTHPVPSVVPAYLDVIRDGGFEEAVIITKTNKNVASFNASVRGRLFPGAAPLVVGDRLIVMQNNYIYGLFNGEFVMVTAVSDHVETKHPLKDVFLSFREITLRAQDPARGVFTITCKILDNLLMRDEPNLTPLEVQGLIVDFQKRHKHLKPKTKLFEDALREDSYVNALRVKHGYAVTCHKAQGGEWKHAFIVFDGRSKGWDNEDFFRWTYTAITRASNHLHVSNAPQFKPTTGITFIDPTPITPPAPTPPTAPISTSDAGTSPLEAQPEDRPDDFEVRLLTLLSGSGATLEETVELPYRKRLLLRHGGKTYRFDVVYNGKGSISQVQPPALGKSDPEGKAMIDDVASRLRELEGSSLNQAAAAGADSVPPLEPDFPEDQPNLESFYRDLQEKLKDTDITIIAVVHLLWAERYTLRRGGQEEEVDFIYNSKGRITHARTVGKRKGQIYQAIQAALSL